MTPHLSHEQLCDAVLARSPHPLSSDFAALQDHLHACPACAAELANLRESLSLFRDASTALAHQELTSQRATHSVRNTPVLPLRSSPLHSVYWAAAAATILVAAALPLSLHRSQPLSPAPSVTAAAPVPTTESDEALLEDINQELSTSIPSPMQPLADPTANSAAAQPTSSPRNN
jgi:hypothetical protein